MILFWTSDRNCQEITGKGEKLPRNCPANYGCLGMLPSFLRRHSIPGIIEVVKDGSGQRRMIHNRRGGQTCGSPSADRFSCHARFLFLPASKGPAWIAQTDTHRKSRGPGKRASCFAFTCAPCFSAIPAHGIRWASKAAVPHRGVVHRRFRPNRCQ